MIDKSDAEIRIDIISDVVCPWCIVGYKQLERALELSGIDAELHWHPFELNPNISAEGENLREHLAAKYGTTPEGSRKARANLTKIGAELGFRFDYADDMRMVNTFKAHQVAHWAKTQGRAHEMEMALFAAFFTYRRDLNDPEVLSRCAAEIGLDAEGARAVLDDGRYAQYVREAEQTWISRGIQGVPAMIFNERYLLSGAQGVENYATALRQIAERSAA